MKRSTFFVFAMVEPPRLGITIQINTCDVTNITVSILLSKSKHLGFDQDK